MIESQSWSMYALHGLAENWIVDPMAESVEIYVLAGKKYELKGSFTGSQVLSTALLPGWEFAVSSLFPE